MNNRLIIRAFLLGNHVKYSIGLTAAIRVNTLDSIYQAIFQSV